MSNDVLETPQPQSIWILVMGVSIMILLLLYIYRAYDLILYISAFLFSFLFIGDLLFKCIEIVRLHINKREERVLNNKFLKSSFLDLSMIVLCLGLRLILKGYPAWMLGFGFLTLCGSLFMIIVEARALIAMFRVKAVEGPK